jgi:hypothetical protein
MLTESRLVFSMNCSYLAQAGLIGTMVLFGLAPSSTFAGEADGIEIPAQLHLADALRLFREHGLDLILAEATVDGVRGDSLLASAAPNLAFSAGVGR